MDGILDFLLNFSGPVPYFIVFGALLICGMGVPIPEDLVLACAGMMAYYETAEIMPMILVGIIGVLAGDSIVFALGATLGRDITKRSFFSKVLSPERLDVVRLKFRRHGNKILFAARFMPGLRAPIFFSAGTLHIPFRLFFLYDGLAAMLSVPLLTYAVYHFGDEVDQVLKIIRDVKTGMAVFVGIVIVYLIIRWLVARARQRPQGSRP